MNGWIRRDAGGLSLGAIVEHTSWGAGKVVETSGPHLVIHFPSLSRSPGGPRRKIQATSTHLRPASEQSHPHLDHDASLSAG